MFEQVNDNDTFDVVDDVPVLNEQEEDDQPTKEQQDNDIYIPEELLTPQEDNSPTPKQATNNEDFVQALQSTFGWDNIPKDAKPVDTLKLIVEMYESEKQALQAQLQSYETNNTSTQYNDEVEDYKAQYQDFKTLSPREAVKQNLLNTEDVTEEEAEEEVADLEMEGKLDRTYKKLIRGIDRDYTSNIEQIKQQAEQRVHLERQEEELRQRELTTTIRSEVQSFKSEFFDVTQNDREMVEYALLKPQENGATLLQNMLSDPKTVIEMVLAYTNLPNLKLLPKQIEKKVQNKIMNKMADEPAFNKKVTTDFTIDSWIQDSEDIELFK